MLANNSTQGLYKFSFLLSGNEVTFFNATLPVISIIGLIVNMLVVAAILTDRALRRMIASIYIVNLALADTLVCIIGAPLWLYQLATKNSNSISCQLTFGLSFVTSGISILTLGIISHDRYSSVTSPFKHMKGRKRAYIKVAITWIYAMILSLPFFVGWKTTNASTRIEYFAFCVYTRIFRQEALLFNFGLALLIMVVTVIFYLKLLSTANYHAERIRQDSQVTLPGISDSTISSVANQVKKQKSLKATKTLGIILGAMLLCWVPFLVLSGLDTLQINTGVSVFMLKLLGTITYLNSILNPVIYTFMSRAFKNSLELRLQRRRSLADINLTFSASAKRKVSK